MARPAKAINIHNTMSILKDANWSLNFTHEDIVQKALKVAHPDYTTNRVPLPHNFIKSLKCIPEEAQGSLTCRQLWDYFPEKSYTCIFQLFKYLKSVNAAMAFHYDYPTDPIKEVEL